MPVPPLARCWKNTEMGARDIAEKALDIAGDICIYTNHFHTIEELPSKA